MPHGTFPVALLLILAGCGGGGAPTGGLSRWIEVTTVPAGAACEVRQADVVVARMTGPEVVQVPRSRQSLDITCGKDGFLTTPVTVQAEEDAALAAFVLLGSGVVGLATQSASGNLHNYPKAVEVVLAPASFPDAAARDTFFDRRVGAVRAIYDPKIARIRSGCTPGDTAGCNALLAEPTEARDAAIRSIEALRGQAAVGS